MDTSLEAPTRAASGSELGASSASLLGHLHSLGDETRLRLMALLTQSEFTVSELIAVVQLPQSSVSRHLKVLADDGWLDVRVDGTSRHYRMASTLPAGAGELWRVVQPGLAHAPWRTADQERARAVLADRRARAQEFFSRSAHQWDELRAELFGARSEIAALFGLLEPSWTVADLGGGTGVFAERVAPFVARVDVVDRSPEMLKAARGRLADRSNVAFHQGDLEALPLRAGSADLAVLLLVLHYVPEPPRVFAEAHRILKPGGRLLIVDMREHGREDYRHAMGHLWTGFSQEQLDPWLGEAGFTRYEHRGLAPEAAATGPLLFVGTATRP